MAEASERQAALPGRVGKPDGACLDEPIDRRRGSHDARIERSARFKCDPSLPEARAAVARDMDRRHAVQARFQIVGRTELDRRLDIPKLRLRSEEHKSELQSLMRISYAVFCLKIKNKG